MSDSDLGDIFSQMQVARDRGIMMEKLVTYMRQLVVLGNERGGHCVAEEGRLSSSEVEAVVSRLSKVRVQAARFRSRCINIMSISSLIFPHLCNTGIPHCRSTWRNISQDTSTRLSSHCKSDSLNNFLLSFGIHYI